MHCIRAIEKSLNFGEHGLPKIGSGDWNDGFSNVGPKGRGESVWLGFFQYAVLDKFSKICENYAKNNEKTDEFNTENITEIQTKQKTIEINKEDSNFDIQNTENIKEVNKKIGLERIEKYKNIMGKLKKALNTYAWDGRWYKRAFMDDGNELR